MIGRLAQDGWIPPMATPTYGRIMNLCQSNHAGIRAVRVSICVQTPWNYAQCLASLELINNALNAIIIGLVSAVVMATSVQWNSAGLGWYHRRNVSFEELERDTEHFFCNLPFVHARPAAVPVSAPQWPLLGSAVRGR
eukprot:gb/GFBE01043649.1/.p1 GENE.gb/GFBE01043649.1/~~gb/GFBE01043649.1/.p1  ORF type:complete len:138 (+),score=12.30 gb/GFBE01043649.1/:1-414(+)